jgi:hypothetical protein
VAADQDKAGKTHVNLNYMKEVGRNQFKWPKYQDLLLIQREDILTKCSAPIGSSFRACSVGLWPSDAAKADAALELVVYLQPFLNILFLFFSLPQVKIHINTHIFSSGTQICIQKHKQTWNYADLVK